MSMAIIFSASPPGPSQHHHLIHACYVGNKFKKELIHLALKEFVEKRRRLNLLDLESKNRSARKYWVVRFFSFISNAWNGK